MAIRTLIRSMALTGLVAATSVQALACGTEAYTGQICVVAGNYCPTNTAEAQGQVLQISQYNALYSLLGCTYGGDCRATFGIPDLRGRGPVGWGQGPGLTAHTVGQKFGQEGVAQTVTMMAQHTHAATFSPSGGGGTNAQVNARQAAATTNAPQAGYMLGQSSTTSGEQANVYLNPSVTPGTDVALSGVSGGGGGSGGGTVTISPTGTSAPTPTVPPEIAVRYCIVLDGIYPPRP
ncbi:phage tail protein [Ideonella sp.]|uniref:phage tail protein n=1 Tax=Ideonella sp. TaxID=1929293 RepID=UPI0035B37797